MADMVNVAVDAMGGDNAPAEVVKGAVEAVHEDKRIKVYLVGKEPLIAETGQGRRIEEVSVQSRTGGDCTCGGSH